MRAAKLARAALDRRRPNQGLRNVDVVIASEATQSRATLAVLDCFVAFAPRNDGERTEKMNKPVLPVSSLSLKLPKAGGAIETYRLAASRTFPAKLQGTLNRVAFSAAHVVADPLADVDPWLTAAVDWDKTIAFRE